jgi:hypothetical protein
MLLLVAGPLLLLLMGVWLVWVLSDVCILGAGEIAAATAGPAWAWICCLKMLLGHSTLQHTL